jgi:riboflavin kinase/FMN adenylyltransferase
MEDRIRYGLKQDDDRLGNCALTIGNFDGVHLGHRAIIERCTQGSASGPVVALTFDPAPEAVLRGGIDIPRIDPIEPKCFRLLEAGADYVVVVEPDMFLLGMTPEEFVQNLIVRSLAPQLVVEGENFRYGVARAGNTATLQAAGRDNDFAVEIVSDVQIDLDGKTQRVSSTLVRRLLGVGDVEGAAKCLSRPFALYGPVIHGQGQGRQLECPTANIETSGQVLPQEGVYAGWAQVEGRRYAAGISIGCRPTMGSEQLAIEAHLLDYQGDLYGKRLTIEFLRRLRDQETYPSLDQLKHQMQKDLQSVRRICPG